MTTTITNYKGKLLEFFAAKKLNHSDFINVVPNTNAPYVKGFTATLELTHDIYGGIFHSNSHPTNKDAEREVCKIAWEWVLGQAESVAAPSTIIPTEPINPTNFNYKGKLLEFFSKLRGTSDHSDILDIKVSSSAKCFIGTLEVKHEVYACRSEGNAHLTKKDAEREVCRLAWERVQQIEPAMSIVSAVPSTLSDLAMSVDESPSASSPSSAAGSLSSLTFNSSGTSAGPINYKGMLLEFFAARGMTNHSAFLRISSSSPPAPQFSAALILTHEVYQGIFESGLHPSTKDAEREVYKLAWECVAQIEQSGPAPSSPPRATAPTLTLEPVDAEALADTPPPEPLETSPAEPPIVLMEDLVLPREESGDAATLVDELPVSMEGVSGYDDAPGLEGALFAERILCLTCNTELFPVHHCLFFIKNDKEISFALHPQHKNTTPTISIAPLAKPTTYKVSQVSCQSCSNHIGVICRVQAECGHVELFCLDNKAVHVYLDGTTRVPGKWITEHQRNSLLSAARMGPADFGRKPTAAVAARPVKPMLERVDMQLEASDDIYEMLDLDAILSQCSEPIEPRLYQLKVSMLL